MDSGKATSAPSGSGRTAPETWDRPIRLTALYREHLALNASLQERGGWLLPASYGDPAGEEEAVRRQAGLLDIGDTGKVVVTGDDLDAVLNGVYPGSSPLDVGRSGLVDTAGTAVLRLTSEQALVLSSSEDLQDVLGQLRDAADSHECAHAVDLTGALCGLRLLGPRAPEVLERVAALDLGPARFPDGAVAQGAVAGIHTIILRRDAGELPGYQLYVDRDLGAYLWHTLLEIGAPLGLRPAGRSIEEEPS